MDYISKEEVIRLYKKPFSMVPREICKHFGYFISEATVRNYIKQGIKTKKPKIPNPEICSVNKTG